MPRTVKLTDFRFKSMHTGIAGAIAIVDALAGAGVPTVPVSVMAVTPETHDDPRLFITIGETTSMFTIEEAMWFARQLAHAPLGDHPEFIDLGIIVQEAIDRARGGSRYGPH